MWAISLRKLRSNSSRKTRKPRKGRPVDLRNIRRVSTPEPSANIIADVRGDR